MIYTLTVNPSIDYIMNVINLKKGYTNRSESEALFVGGRGVNVAKILKMMGHDSIALGFLGGFTGMFVKRMLEHIDLKHDFVKISDETRVNLKISSEGYDTEINANGPTIKEECIEKLMDKLQVLKEGDYMLLCGSVAEGPLRDLYKRVGRLCNEKKVKLVINADGKTFMEMLAYKPFFIKPNDKDLGIMFDTTILTREAVYRCGKKAVDMGAENVIVTMSGLEGSIYFDKDRIITSELMDGKTVNKSGVGDATVAAFIGEYVNSNDTHKAFKMGVAAGRATACTAGLCTYDEMLARFEKVKTTVI